MPSNNDPYPDHPEPSSPSSGTGTLGRALVDLLETIAPAFVIALLINFFLAQSTYVYGHSMEPNLHTDQRLVVEKVTYRLRPPQRGDIVVIDVETSDIPLIKRVIGLPGETVSIHDNQVFIDGQPLTEGYLEDVVQRDYSPQQVPAGHIFVLGDNRDASNDSRYFGAVSLEQVLGRAWLSYWPLSELHFFR
jgi:signal peptidase I